MFLCFEVDSYSVAQAVLQLFSGLLVLFYSFTLGEPPASAFGVLGFQARLGPSVY